MLEWGKLARGRASTADVISCVSATRSEMMARQSEPPWGEPLQPPESSNSSSQHEVWLNDWLVLGASRVEGT